MRRCACLRGFLAAAIVCQSLTPSVASAANPFEAVLDVVHNVKRRAGMERPQAVKVPSVERVAGEIDWLEHKVETFGTVVPKQPDVWGEARLTKYRREVEQQLAARLGSFEETLQGSIRRSDQSFLSAALTLSIAADGAAAFPTATGSTPASTLNAFFANTGDPNASGQRLIDRTGPTNNVNFSQSMPGADGERDPLSISIEPTVFNNQLDRYLKALNQLRRINEGDDTSDSPGYSLNLVRIPVSVLPGKMTRKGYGAEVSLTVEPQITDDLLPSTMRSLIVNDVVNLHSLPVAQELLNDPATTGAKITAYMAHQPRVAKWMTAFDYWLADMQAESDRAPSNSVLRHTAAYLHANRSYLEARLFQIAEAASAQDTRAVKGEIDAEDFAAVEHFRTDTESTKLCDEGTLAITFSALAHWFDALSKKPHSVYGMQGLVVYFSPQLLTATDFAKESRDCLCSENGCDGFFKEVIKASLKAPEGITRDFSVLRELPIEFENNEESDATSQRRKQAPHFRYASHGNGKKPQREPLAQPQEEVAPDLQDKRPVATAARKQPGSSESAKRQRTIVMAIRNLTYENTTSLALDAMSGIGQAAEILRAAANSRLRNARISLSPVGPSPAGVLSTDSRASRRPIPPSAYPEVMGYQPFMNMVREANAALNRQLAGNEVNTYLDIRAYLQEETHAAYRWLEDSRNSHMWHAFATSEMAQAVSERNFSLINLRRNQFLQQSGSETRSDVTATLAWSILVDAALLNQRLIDDMKRVAKEKGCGCLAGDGMNFVGPAEAIAPNAQEAFKDYARCRWPIQVFALDPVADEQNIADQFSRRRELQLALAVGVAQGNVRANAASRFARRLETDIETIALNRTAVGFSHGNDTFGWRFYPRLQTPDTPGTLGAMWETIAGGPDPDADLRDRGLEPGIRECTAIVVMPSFIPHVTFDSRASWFSLTNPRRKAFTMKDTMKISRNYQAVRRSLNCAREHCAYRPGDVAQMSRVVDQIERRLPLQHMRVPVPFENTLGGFQMFQAGITDLAPELYGWYGAPGVQVGHQQQHKTNTVTKEKAGDITVDTTVDIEASDDIPTTTIFLVGSRFSVHETRVIAGGKTAPHTLISREIMEINVPANANTVEHTLADGKTTKYVDVHVATPYGVTNHLLVRVDESDEQATAAENAVALGEAVKKVDEIEKSVAQVRRNLPIMSSDEPELKLIAVRQPNTHFRISPAMGSDSVTVAAANDVGFATKGKVEIAFFSEAQNKYLTGRFDTRQELDFKGSTGHPRKDEVKLSAEDLAKELTNQLGESLSGSNFSDDKLELRGVLFFRPEGSGDNDPRIRFLGEIKVEIALDTTSMAALDSISAPAYAASPRRLPPAVANRSTELLLHR